jgi:multidrug resistance efflux pump
MLAGGALAAEPDAGRAIGVVRETEIQLAPEVNGRLASIHVAAGQLVQKGDLIATLSAPELAARVGQAKADQDQAQANRDHVFAGVRQEQIAIAAENVRIGESNLKLANQQYARVSVLTSKAIASQQQLDEATAARDNAVATLARLKAALQESQAGPTKEERAAAEAELGDAIAKHDNLEAKFAKTRIVAPADGIVGLIVASEGEVISPGQAIVTLYAPSKRWFSFSIREDRLRGLTIGSRAEAVAADGRKAAARVTEIRPLGEFATWRAARAVGDHDLNSFLLRAEPDPGSPDLPAGMTVWLEPASAPEKP